MKGIDNPEIYSNLPPTTPSPTDSIIFQHILLTNPTVRSQETVIQFYAVQLTLSGIFSTMAAFHSTSLDAWGRQPRIRVCQNDPDFQLYRSVSLAYISNIIFTWQSEFFPELIPSFEKLVVPWGVDPHLCDDPSNCQDIETPWGLAYSYFQDVLDWVQRDGWNRDGELSREFNRIPFEDWTNPSYVPENDPWSLTRPRKWQPLLEQNGLGFLFHQEHETPHIGQFGKSYFIGDDDYCSFKSKNPRYRYTEEIDLLLERSRNMALDEGFITQAKIELFDNKFISLASLQNEVLFRNGFSGDSWEYIENEFLTSSVLYEASLLVWREKVRFDFIRPNTRIAFTFGDDRVLAYAGPGQGVQNIRANEWLPYIRTMPHSEFPSGSACFCQVWASVMSLWFGGDDITIGGVQGSLSLVLPENGSIVEPGLPNGNIVLNYDRFSEISEDCGQSRLDGGMHFTASVPDGASLCAPLAEKVFISIRDLVSGERPGNVVDFDSPLRTVKRCA